MKKFIMSLILIALFASVVMAYPSHWGTRGLLRTISADNEGKGYLTLSLHGNYFQKDVTTQVNVDRLGGPTHRNSTVYLSSAFAPLSFLELSGGIAGQLVQDPDIYRAEGISTEWGFGDAFLGSKLSYSPLWWVTVGGFGYFTFPTASSALKDSGFANQKNTFGGLGCVTFDLSKEKVRLPLSLKIHLNAGFHSGYETSRPDSMKFHGAKEAILLRGGVEIPAGNLNIFVAYSTELSTIGRGNFGDNPMRITPGVRFMAGPVSCFAGVDIGLGNGGTESWRSLDKMDWKINLGVAFITRVVHEQPIPLFAKVSGVVTDADKKTPVHASVRLEDQPETERSITATVDGHYSIMVGKGVHNVVFTAPGYRTFSTAISVESETGIPLDVELMPLGTDGTLTGKVSDGVTLAPLSATITFDKSTVSPIETDPKTGAFKTDLAAGSYTLVVESKGYHTVNEVVVIEKGKIIQKDIVMLTEGSPVGKVSGTVTDENTNQPVRSMIEIAKGGFSPISVDPITGVYTAVLPAGTYNLKASAEGYLSTTVTVVIEVGKTNVQPITLKPVPAGMITGKVVNTKDKLPLAANISFPGSNLPTIRADENGIYKQSVPPGNYTVKAEFEGFIAQAFPVNVEDDKTVTQNFELIKPGEKIILEGIYFDFDKSTIKPESRGTLDQAIKILRDNPTIQVRISGHTDSKGSDQYNLSLSYRRADAVKKYLVQNGSIDASRIESVGKGETEPIATNDTDEGRSLNRRIEFLVIGEK